MDGFDLSTRLKEVDGELRAANVTPDGGKEVSKLLLNFSNECTKRNMPS